MFCYGEKEAWYKRKVPSGMLPALELDGRMITESDVILTSLEKAFGPLGSGKVRVVLLYSTAMRKTEVTSVWAVARGRGWRTRR
jgi:glutathione S-transferase